MDYGLLAPMSVGQVHCSSSGSESCKGRGPNRCWVSTWIHPYTPTHYLLGALFLSCRVLHKYPAFVAPGAAQVPTGASFFAVFHASVSTGETEAKTEATNHGKGGKTAFRHFSHASTILLVAVEFCLGGKSFLLSDFWIIAKKGSLHT